MNKDKLMKVILAPCVSEKTTSLGVNNQYVFKVRTDATKDQIEVLSLQSQPAVKALNGGSPKKIIVVPGRLVNIVA